VEEVVVEAEVDPINLRRNNYSQLNQMQDMVRLLQLGYSVNHLANQSMPICFNIQLSTNIPFHSYFYF